MWIQVFIFSEKKISTRVKEAAEPLSASPFSKHRISNSGSCSSHQWSCSNLHRLNYSQQQVVDPQTPFFWASVAYGDSYWEITILMKPQAQIMVHVLSWTPWLKIYICSTLTNKQLEMHHGCVLSTVATDGLVLKHQAINIHTAD